MVTTVDGREIDMIPEKGTKLISIAKCICTVIEIDERAVHLQRSNGLQIIGRYLFDTLLKNGTYRLYQP